MMKTRDLRPTLPAELDAELESLIEDAWHPDPAARPTFRVLLLRLQMFVKMHLSTRRKQGNEQHSRDVQSMLQATERKVDIEDEALSLLRELHRRSRVLLTTSALPIRPTHAVSQHFISNLPDCLWDCKTKEWDEKRATRAVAEEATIGAADATLRAILSGERGAGSLRACGELMVAGFEDGSEIVPDPLFAEDVMVDAEDMEALMTIRFGVSAAGQQKRTREEWKEESKVEFSALAEALSAAGKDERCVLVTFACPPIDVDTDAVVSSSDLAARKALPSQLLSVVARIVSKRAEVSPCPTQEARRFPVS